MSVHKLRSARLAAVLASATALAVAGATPLAQAGAGRDEPNGRLVLRTTLTGAKEVPGPGDPDGRGSARVVLKQTEICFEVSWSNIDAPTAGHIHVGGRDVAGPIAFGMFSVAPPGLGAPVSSVGGCADAGEDLVTALRRNPQGYYVNIHNPAFPAGAIRGQLHRA